MTNKEVVSIYLPEQLLHENSTHYFKTLTENMNHSGIFGVPKGSVLLTSLICKTDIKDYIEYSKYGFIIEHKNELIHTKIISAYFDYLEIKNNVDLTTRFIESEQINYIYIVNERIF